MREKKVVKTTTASVVVVSPALFLYNIVMLYTIYSITHRASGKMYIGFTEDAERRMRQHKRAAVYGGGCRVITRALQKYGVDAFDFVVESQTEDKSRALRREQHYIKAFHTLAPNGYNLTTGGEAPEISDETKARISAAQTGKTRTAETRANISAAAKEAMNRPEVKAKIAATNAKPETKARRAAVEANPEVKARRSAASKESMNRPEVKARWLAAVKETWSQPAVKARHSAAQKEAQNRPEVKARKSAAMKEANERPEVQARRSAAQKEAQNRPEVKAKRSAANKEANKRPEVKAKIAAALRAACIARNYAQMRQVFIWRREDPKVSMNELARRLGVTRPTIKRWLTAYQPADVGL